MGSRRKKKKKALQDKVGMLQVLNWLVKHLLNVSLQQKLLTIVILIVAVTAITVV